MSHLIYYVAAVMVVLGAILLRYSVSDVEKFYARFMVFSGVVFFILPSLWGCGSPTAPSSTVSLTFAPAPGCAPGSMPSQPKGNPVLTYQLPGSKTLTAAWVVEGKTLKVEFQESFTKNMFLICEWSWS